MKLLNMNLLFTQNPDNHILYIRLQTGASGHQKYEQDFTLNKFKERLKGILMEIAK